MGLKFTDASGKSKVLSSSKPNFIKGGSGKMTGNKVGTQTPGQTATKPTSTGGKFAKGGGTGFIGGKQPKVVASVPGKISTTGATAGNKTGSGGGRRGTGTG